MPLSPLLPKRKSPRAGWINYNTGCFFITVCTKDKKHHFGYIFEGIMHLSTIGQFLKNELSSDTSRYPSITIVDYVVMPNHFHAVILIEDNNNQSNLPMLSKFVGGIKSAVTRFSHINGHEFAWQSRFHDHMIRNRHEWERITDYVLHNVDKWGEDIFNE